ncbi:MAG: TonB-dependent receptor [Gammaproteobacteria bacterium]|nr:TonB-dependent receptor [Gammaproteobacteria bacterium]
MRKVIFPALLLPACLQAAGPEANPSFPLPASVLSASEVVVVSAARVPVPVSTIGSGTTVITRAEIERRNPRFVSDLLRDVPGVAVTRNGGPGSQTQVRVRGAEGNHVLVLIDGVEANDFSQADEFDFAHLTVSDIERIEVVRGPQSSLWGSDALAGVINIITRDAVRPLEVDGSVETGSFGTERGALSLGGARGTVRGRVGLSYFETGGINIARRGAEDDGYRNAAANFKFGWRPMETFKLDLHGRLTDSESAFDGIDPDTGLRTDIDATTDVVQAYVGGRAELATFDHLWTHALIGGWTKLDNAARDPTDFGDRRNEGRKYSLDYQSTFRLETAPLVPVAHVLTLAVDYDMEEFNQRGPVSFFGDPNQDRRRHTLGYVVEYRATVYRDSTLGITGRWDDNSNIPDIGTWRALFSQQFPTLGTTLSAVYATGQKAPTFTERYGFSNGGFLPFVGNASLQPERSQGYELGLRQIFLQERASASVTYFNEHLFDEIDGFFFDPDRFVLTAVNRSGSSKRRGVEFAGGWRLLQGLNLNAGYTWLDATEIRSGLRKDEIRRPHDQATLSLNWQDASGRLVLDTHLNYAGDSRDLTFLPPTYDGLTTLEARTLVGVSASWQFMPRVALTARLENLFDDDYEEVFDFQTEGVSGYLGLRFALSP